MDSNPVWAICVLGSARSAGVHTRLHALAEALQPTVLLPALGLLVLAPLARAQLFEDWRTRLDLEPAAPDVGQVCAAGPNGELYVAGHTRPASSQWLDALLVRLDGSGALVWSRTHSGDVASDSARAIAVDPGSGNVYAAIHRLIDHPTNDARVVAWDPNGNELWSFVYAGRAADRDFVGGHRMALDGAGNLYVPFQSMGASVPGGSGFDIVVVSLAPDGTVRWEDRHDGAAHVNDYPADIAVDGQRVLVCGHVDLGGAGIGKLFLRAYGLDGVPLWTRTVAVPGIATLADELAFDADGNAYVAGRALDGFLYMDAWLWSFDPAGNPRWATAIGTQGLIGRSFLRLGALGELVLAGSDQGETNDVFVVGFDRAGNRRWSAAWDGIGTEDVATALALDEDGQCAITVSNGAPDRFHLLAYSRDGARTVARPVVTGSSAWISHALAVSPRDTVCCGSAAAGGTAANELLVLRLRTPFEAFCFGDGSSGACPCGNASPAGERRGCAHSHGPGARLTATGASSVAADELVLATAGLPAATTAILLQSDARVASIPFGDGLRCIDGALRRAYTGAASSGSLLFPRAGDPSFSARSAALGDPLAPGSTRHYQLYFRNATPAFCTPDTFNMSNAISVEWGA